MTRIIATLCTFNEADRYLKQMLEWNQEWWDELFVYDDQSIDNTVDVVWPYADEIVVRQDTVAPFAQHEGEFRQAAWEALEMWIGPQPGDWIFAIDADEFLVSPEMNIYADVRKCIHQNDVPAFESISLPVPEVWEVQGKNILIRTDGHWNENRANRLFRYQPDGTFRTKAMACGSVPTYADTRPSPNNHGLELLHFGYSQEEDREQKFLRYHGRPGHGKKHIASIRNKNPDLEKWQGGDLPWLA